MGFVCSGLLTVIIASVIEFVKNSVRTWQSNSEIPRCKLKSIICNDTHWKRMLDKPCHGRSFHYCKKKTYFLNVKVTNYHKLYMIFFCAPLLLICWKPIADTILALLFFMPKTIWWICFAKEINLLGKVKYGLSMRAWKVSVFQTSFSPSLPQKGTAHTKVWPEKELVAFTWE